ncbi:MAG: 4-hydroxy-3-methylbut-2-enyl diphosphate reductase [Acidobacteria bacterium]|nr:4-hydroxy-3-methylbut-2-enyl diphosphate reductase [Acidobacteriota bacterium]MDW7983095.1 4-hydroxy-3-methylbut-2-enyl diphosphate reductase [Acidobacteriota bacterium]
MESGPVIRKGFQLKKQVLPVLRQDYASTLIDWFRAHDFEVQVGQTRIVLAREFGFCYGVDRAIQYAYETRARFPDRRVFLTGEIIHNPFVNRRLQESGIEFLPRTPDGRKDYTVIQSEDVVILPAFGVSVEEMEALQTRGCIVVDTTCGSVMNVWKSVRQYARDGFTSVIHGKYWHEETRATASQAVAAGGHYLIVLNRSEAHQVADFIRHGGDPMAFLRAFRQAVSPGFDPTVHLVRVGLANQTTMLMNESLEIQEILRQAMVDRYGTDCLAEHFRAFDTICSATQDRQDAVQVLLQRDDIDLMIVIGGFNSSNTGSLLHLCQQKVPSFHIEGVQDLVSADRIRHKPYMQAPAYTNGWLPSGPLTIGLTAGASTPNSVVAGVVLRLLDLRGEHWQDAPWMEALQTVGAPSLG